MLTRNNGSNAVTSNGRTGGKLPVILVAGMSRCHPKVWAVVM